jgi:hypothetical protein
MRSGDYLSSFRSSLFTSGLLFFSQISRLFICSAKKRLKFRGLFINAFFYLLMTS